MISTFRVDCLLLYSTYTCICLTHCVDNSRRRATVVPNSVDRISFDYSAAVARCVKPRRALQGKARYRSHDQFINLSSLNRSIFFSFAVAIWPVTGQGFQNTEGPAVSYCH